MTKAPDLQIVNVQITDDNGLKDIRVEARVMNPSEETWAELGTWLGRPLWPRPRKRWWQR